MKYLGPYSLLPLVIILVAASACGEEKSEIAKKKEKLAELKLQLRETKEEIKELEKELAIADPSFILSENKATLVSTMPVEKRVFKHKIEVRGEVASRKNILLGSEAVGRINKIHVKEGDEVTKGQLLLEIDAATLRNNIAELKTSLELATTVFERQQNLWKKNIGSEIQYLQAKNNKESLERKLATAHSELDKARVRAPFGGTIDKVHVKQGEMAQIGLPLFRIVSLEDMYINADVSERYIGKFKRGDSVKVYFPSLDKQFRSVISAIGQVINERNRTFEIEVRLPLTQEEFKPNLTAVIELKDYENKQAIVVPTSLIQSDNIGDFVYKIDRDNGKSLARKVHIDRGLSYDRETEILAGLEPGEELIEQGVRNISEGVFVRLANR